MHLKRLYRLDWLVDQETFSVPNIFSLEDCDLIRLLNMMERARECIAEGISFDDAGIVRSVRSAAIDVQDPNGDRNADAAAVANDRLYKTRPRDTARAEQPPF